MKIIDLNELRQRANALSRSEFETRLRQRIGALGRTLAHHVGNTVAARELRCLANSIEVTQTIPAWHDDVPPIDIADRIDGDKLED